MKLELLIVAVAIAIFYLPFYWLVYIAYWGVVVLVMEMRKKNEKSS